MSRGPVTEITLDSLEALAIGAGILGTGGGGSPYLGKVRCRVLMTELGVTIPVHQVGDIDDDAVVSSVGGIGAPTVGIERPGEGTELAKGVRVLEQYTGKLATHMISAEIGGGNAIAPLIAAIQLGLPVVDGDGMGRAFPELQMDTYMIYGLKPTPNVLTGTHGHSVIFDNITDAKDLERYARAIAVGMGGGAGGSGPFMSGAEVKDTAIPGTLTLAIRIGEAVIDAREKHEDPIAATLSVTGGQVLFTGKITNVERRTVGGFARGTLEMAGTHDDTGDTLSIDLQNENLVARNSAGEVLCSVPDLICIVNAETADPIATEELRYGLRVAVLGIPAPARIATPEALEVVGPAAFGYPDVAYKPLPGTYGSGLQMSDNSGT